MILTEQDYLGGQIILIDKPLDWTSFNVVNKIRWKIRKQFNLKKIKVGHAGTLDPRATGLLIICTGKATKNISEIQDADKEYIATIKLGVETKSYDTETEEFNHKPYEHISIEQIKSVLKKWTGTQIEQVPPIYSAIMKDGKRAYEFARAGEKLELKSRPINIYEIDIIDFLPPLLKIKISCSKGTYIRSLAHDIGKDLGCGAYLIELIRTKIGRFNLLDVQNKLYLD